MDFNIFSDGFSPDVLAGRDFRLTHLSASELDALFSFDNSFTGSYFSVGYACFYDNPVRSVGLPKNGRKFAYLDVSVLDSELFKLVEVYHDVSETGSFEWQGNFWLPVLIRHDGSFVNQRDYDFGHQCYPYSDGDSLYDFFHIREGMFNVKKIFDSDSRLSVEHWLGHVASDWHSEIKSFNELSGVVKF